MAVAGGADWFGTEFKRAYEDQFRQTGRFNLAVFGKTGVGKSTLVNAIFGAEVATTGIGAPVTQANHLYMHESGFLGVLDTKGLEVGQDNSTIIGELDAYIQSSRRKPLTEQLHVAWYCVRALDRRFEDTEAELIQALDKLGLPVVLVLTQTPQIDGQLHPDVALLAQDIEARGLPIHTGRAFPVMAKPDAFNRYEDHGLMDVLDATFRVAPVGVAAALNAAQQIDEKRKREAAHEAVGVAVTAAGVAGATPIPFADAVVLVPIQMAMMAKIAQVYAVDIDKATTATLAATAAATAAGRSAVTSLLKFIPGANLVGGAISASVASTVTYAMGQAWIVVCRRLTNGEFAGIGGALDSQAIRDVFMHEFKSSVSKRVARRKSEPDV